MVSEHEQNVEVLLSQIEANSRAISDRMLVMEKRLGVVEANSAATADTLRRWHRRRTGVASIVLGVFLGLLLTGLAWIMFGGIFRAMLSMH